MGKVLSIHISTNRGIGILEKKFTRNMVGPTSLAEKAVSASF
ncbi:MAG: hypothetical protein K0R55_645 [Sporomusa sp.]|jgi:hypothetical protein|nr:hypothetical protein [Sporomusa sp.]